MRRTAAAVVMVVVAALATGGALAGRRAVSGQQTLQIKDGLSPDRARAGGVTLHLRFEYRSTQAGQQPPYRTRTITFVLPRGLRLDPTAAPACKRSQIERNHGEVSKCPRRTRVGSGRVIVNARPAVAKLITGRASLYNAVNDLGLGEPRGTRNLIFLVRTSVGITATFPFRILRLAEGRVALRAKLPKPKQPGISPGSFSIQTVVVALGGRSHPGFLTNPAGCSGGWAFSATLTNYFGGPSITARDRARCRP